MAKKKTKAKRVVKKKVSRSIKHEVIVRVQTQSEKPTFKDLEPLKGEDSKYMIPKTWLAEKQIIKMVQKTPKQHVFQRKGKGGQIWDYVTGSYVEKVLNFVFGWNWDFDVVQHGKEGDLVWVLGKLTVKDDHGHSISKSQFGRADIKYKKDSKIMLDFGNDLKAATTDALKKCASLLGIASDIYGKAEFKQEADVDVAQVTVPQIAPHPTISKVAISSNEPVEYLCHGATKGGCPQGRDITKQEYDFSKRIFGKPLCRSCQKLVNK